MAKMTPQEIAATVQGATKVLSDGLLQLREYNNTVKVQDSAVDKAEKAQNIANIVSIVAACLPGTISIIRELFEAYKIFTDEGVPIPSPAEFVELAALVAALPSAQGMKLPADVQAVLDAKK